jgi:hypothetical protein
VKEDGKMKSKKVNMMKCIGMITMVVLGVQVSVAATYTWIGTEAGADWLNPANWNPNGLPSRAASDTGYINTVTGPVFYDGSGSCHALEIGQTGEGRMDILGGTFSATGFDVGSAAGFKGTLNVYGGTHECRYLCPGFRGDGTVNMYDGQITVTGEIRVAYYATAIGFLNLEGGLITSPGISIAPRGGGDIGSILVKDGVLLINGANAESVLLPRLQGYINNGWITAADGYELVLVFNGDKYPGVTALYAIPEPATLALLAAGLMGVIRRRR